MAGGVRSKHMGRLAILLVATGLLVIGGGAAAVANAQSTSTVEMREFEFVPADLRVSSGRVTFTLQNTGQFPHNLHIEGNGVSMDVAPTNVAGGESFTGAVNLTPGTYETWCPVDAHRERGMVGSLTVAGAGGGAGAGAGAGAGGAAVQVPGRLPRTGDADTLPIAQASIAAGLLLVGGGLFLRRRAAQRS